MKLVLALLRDGSRTDFKHSARMSTTRETTKIEASGQIKPIPSRRALIHRHCVTVLAHELDGAAVGLDRRLII